MPPSSAAASSSGSSGAICIVPGCGKPTYNNAKSNRYCSKECKMKPVCMRPGCGKKTFNGRPNGYCTPQCRDKDHKMTGTGGNRQKKYDPWKDKEMEKMMAEWVEKKGLLMTEEEREIIETRQAFAKNEILTATTSLEVLQKAEFLIEEEWIKNSEVPGNIYRIGAFGRLQIGIAAMTWEKLRENPLLTLMPLIRAYGSLCVWLLQIIGPPAIFLSTWSPMGAEGGTKVDWANWHLAFSDWKHIAYTKLLAMTCINIFCLNGLFVILEERRAWAKMESIFRYLKQRCPEWSDGCNLYIYMDAFTNLWVVLWCCCVDSIVVIGVSASPKDVLYDSLGLLFLYNLDDISSGLGFISDADWHGGKIGWMYQEMVRQDWQLNTDSVPFNEEDRGCDGKVIMFMYQATTFLIGLSAICLPPLTCLTPFLEITGEHVSRHAN